MRKFSLRFFWVMAIFVLVLSVHNHGYDEPFFLLFLVTIPPSQDLGRTSKEVFQKTSNFFSILYPVLLGSSTNVKVSYEFPVCESIVILPYLLILQRNNKNAGFFKSSNPLHLSCTITDVRRGWSSSLWKTRWWLIQAPHKIWKEILIWKQKIFSPTDFFEVSCFSENGFWREIPSQLQYTQCGHGCPLLLTIC